MSLECHLNPKNVHKISLIEIKSQNFLFYVHLLDEEKTYWDVEKTNWDVEKTHTPYDTASTTWNGEEEVFVL